VAASHPNETDECGLTIRELLDHIAVELAHEYVRLMEAAAQAGSDDKTPEAGEN
jgi:hypothetical protein